MKHNQHPRAESLSADIITSNGRDFCKRQNLSLSKNLQLLKKSPRLKSYYEPTDISNCKPNAVSNYKLNASNDKSSPLFVSNYKSGATSRSASSIISRNHFQHSRTISRAESPPKRADKKYENWFRWTSKVVCEITNLLNNPPPIWQRQTNFGVQTKFDQKLNHKIRNIFVTTVGIHVFWYQWAGTDRPKHSRELTKSAKISILNFQSNCEIKNLPRQRAPRKE